MIELNKVLITGRLTRDPELKYIPSGTAVCDIRLASSRRFMGKDSGERKEETLFINVTAWGKTAEFCNEYLHKGTAILVEGRLKLETWQDKDGNNRDRISITADRIQFAESKAESDARASGGAGGGGGSISEPQTEAAHQSSGQTTDQPKDDLPF